MGTEPVDLQAIARLLADLELAPSGAGEPPCPLDARRAAAVRCFRERWSTATFVAALRAVREAYGE